MGFCRNHLKIKSYKNIILPMNGIKICRANLYKLIFSPIFMKRSSRRWKKKNQMRWKWQRKRLKKEKHKRKLRRERAK